ncbi:MAG: LytR family transcriptional regulator [Lachnospiraceae bacterium]|jgi:LCP family protein required for cell wall assembly|nr:LytR family transcriptional regulator [Lachnospiraceae bacterium]
MSRDYDEELRRPERKSRRNPRMARQTGAEKRPGTASQTGGLKVMNDAAVHPVGGRGQERAYDSGRRMASVQTAAGSTAGGGRSRTAGGVRPAGSFQQREQDNARKRRRRRIIGMIIAECFALIFIFGYGYMVRLMNQVKRPVIDMQQVENQDLDVVTKEKLKGYWTIAVFGVDARDNTIDKDTNSDVNIICNINLETGEIKLVSLFRDTYLNISKEGSYNKFNQAYFLGGPEQAMSALNRNLDLNITDYVTFNWKAVADAINILGGVDVELSKAEFYYINSFITETAKTTGVGSTHLSHAGMNHLDGVQAVAYGRLRLMDTDFARTERQRKVIKLAFEKAKTADFDTLNRVLGTVFPQVSTSLWVDDIYISLKNINKYHLGETMGFPEARGDAKMGKKGACVIPQTLETNVVKLHQFLFGTDDYAPSETVKNISKKIAADSGMYKEGNYVKSVNTDGGVIQPPKTTAAAETTKATEAEDDDRYEYIYVLNSNGKKVRKRITRETDADGDYVEQETDEDGIAIGWALDEDGELVRRKSTAGGRDPLESSVSDRPGIRPTEPETDENGNIIETEENNIRPGESTPSANPTRPGLRPTNGTDEQPSVRPTTAETDPSGRPVGTEPSRGSLEGPGGMGTTEPTRSTQAVNPTPQPAPSPGGNTTNPVNPTVSGNNSGPGGDQNFPGASSPGGSGGSPMDMGGQSPGGSSPGGGVVTGPGQ